MGKIRIKTFDETSSKDEAKAKAKKEAKKAEKLAAKNAKKALVSETIDEPIAKDALEAQLEASEDLSKPDETVIANDAKQSKENSSSHPELVSGSETKKIKTKKEKFAKANTKTLSKRYKENTSLVSKNEKYTLSQALEALKKFKKSKFDETVELHINTKEKGVNGQVTLPHGTGKTLKIKIADDGLLAEVEKGKITFDILVATPSMMPSLAKVARVLGPKGLMPNPKNGTISENPQDAVKKLSGGQTNYKTESQFPIIHTRVGKISFDNKKLEENITTFITSVGRENIKSVTLKSTMSPGIKLVV